MPPEDVKPTEQGSSGQMEGETLLRKEQEVLGRARVIARRITARVKQTLKDTESHASLPTEENPPLP
jgi:hypothetical protein